MTISLSTRQSKISESVNQENKGRKFPRWLLVSLLTGLGLGAGAIATGISLHHHHFNLDELSVKTQFYPITSHPTVSFKPVQSPIYDLEFTLNSVGDSSPLVLKNVDLRLMLPHIPDAIQEHKDLVRWMLTEREFNRQEFVFSGNSAEVILPNQVLEVLGGDRSQISIGLINPNRRAGEWELAIYGKSQQILYQGYFHFPKGVYAQLFQELNQVSYDNYASDLEGWLGLNFHQGMPFDVSVLRTVKREYQIRAKELTNQEILVNPEEEKPSSEIVNYPEIAHLQQATARTIQANQSNQELLELELVFTSDRGKTRKLIVSGIDWQQIPVRIHKQDQKGLYFPLGFPLPFHQSYQKIKHNSSPNHPLFSVIIDRYNLVINHRQSIGIYGLELHRDQRSPHQLHLSFLSDPQTPFVNHYILDLTKWVLTEHPEP